MPKLIKARNNRTERVTAVRHHSIDTQQIVP